MILSWGARNSWLLTNANLLSWPLFPFWIINIVESYWGIFILEYAGCPFEYFLFSPIHLLSSIISSQSFILKCINLDLDWLELVHPRIIDFHRSTDIVFADDYLWLLLAFLALRELLYRLGSGHLRLLSANLIFRLMPHLLTSESGTLNVRITCRLANAN